MKTKLFLAAVAVTFSFAVISCSGNKANNAAASEGEEATVETVEAVAVEATDSCCQAKDSCATACDKKADCTEKKECCEIKRGYSVSALCPLFLFDEIRSFISNTFLLITDFNL